MMPDESTDSLVPIWMRDDKKAVPAKVLPSRTQPRLNHLHFDCVCYFFGCQTVAQCRGDVAGNIKNRLVVACSALANPTSVIYVSTQPRQIPLIFCLAVGNGAQNLWLRHVLFARASHYLGATATLRAYPHRHRTGRAEKRILLEDAAFRQGIEAKLPDSTASKTGLLLLADQNFSGQQIRLKTKLIPDDTDRAYAIFEQACSVEQSYFGAASETIGTELVINKYGSATPLPKFPTVMLMIAGSHRAKGIPTDPARVAQAEADLDKVLAYYETVLSKQEYLAGDTLTLVDLFHLPNGSALKAFEYRSHFEKYPAVEQWFTGLQRRETWVNAAAQAGTAV
nr:glutathione s-transferase hmp2 [Quercus suber]